MNADEIKELLRYENGRLYWKVQNRGRTKKGGEAGLSTNGKYKVVTVRGKGYYVHRLIFLMHNGYMPKFIDHIDGIELNNKIENLRESNKAQNQYNSKMVINNTSGSKNVYRDSRSNRWFVKFVINGNQKFFGYFWTFNEAVKVANETRKILHGEFACDYS